MLRMACYSSNNNNIIMIMLCHEYPHALQKDHLFKKQNYFDFKKRDED